MAGTDLAEVDIISTIASIKPTFFPIPIFNFSLSYFTWFLLPRLSYALFVILHTFTYNMSGVDESEWKLWSQVMRLLFWVWVMHFVCLDIYKGIELNNRKFRGLFRLHFGLCYIFLHLLSSTNMYFGRQFKFCFRILSSKF